MKLAFILLIALLCLFSTQAQNFRGAYKCEIETVDSKGHTVVMKANAQKIDDNVFHVCMQDLERYNTYTTTIKDLTLHFERNDLQDLQIGFKSLATLKDLEYLNMNFQQNRLTNIDLGFLFQDMVELKELTVNYLKQDTEHMLQEITSLERAFGNLKNLEKLDINVAYNNVQAIPEVFSVALNGLENLTDLTLNFKDNQQSVASLDFLDKMFESVPQLQHFHVSFGLCLYLHDVSALKTAFNKLDKLKTLYLDLEGNNFTELDLQLTHQGFKSITLLLGNNNIDNIDFLGKLFQDKPALREIAVHLQYTKVTDMSVFQNALTYCDKLESLTIDNSHNGASDISYLTKALEGLHSLRSLHIKSVYNKITDISALEKAFKGTQAEDLQEFSLDLSWNDIKSIEVLADSLSIFNQLQKFEMRLTENDFVDARPMNEMTKYMPHSVESYTVELDICNVDDVNLKELNNLNFERYRYYAQGYCRIVQCNNPNCLDCQEKPDNCTKCLNQEFKAPQCNNPEPSEPSQDGEDDEDSQQELTE